MLLEFTCHGSDIIFQYFSLTLECADEDGMRYRSVMSSLLQEYGGVGIYVKVMRYRSVMSSLLQDGGVGIYVKVMRYRSVMSSLLQEYGGVGIYVKVMRYRSVMSSLLQEYGGVSIMHKFTLQKCRLICTFIMRLQQQNFSHDWAYKWVYERDSLCNGNWPIN